MVYGDGFGKTFDMKFFLFSEIEFEIQNPPALIECYCFQTDFFVNFDLLPKREVKDANEIGAHIQSEPLQKCIPVAKNAKAGIFEWELDEFLDLDNEDISHYVEEVSEGVIKTLMNIPVIPRIGLSKATKILHTLYPEIIPMIDNMLQTEYKRINQEWKKGNPHQILIAYYENLKIPENRQQLTQVFDTISKKGLGRTSEE